MNVNNYEKEYRKRKEPLDNEISHIHDEIYQKFMDDLKKNGYAGLVRRKKDGVVGVIKVYKDRTWVLDVSFHRITKAGQPSINASGRIYGEIETYYEPVEETEAKNNGDETYKGKLS